jgi:hypothetical protein
MKVPIMGIPRLSLGSLRIKCHLDVAPWKVIENTGKGKVVASPKSGPW